MRVISNTSPVTNLAAVGHLDLLHMLYGQTTIASDICDELVLGGGSNNPGANIVNTASRVHIEYVDPLARDQLARQFPALHSRRGGNFYRHNKRSRNPLNLYSWMTEQHAYAATYLALPYDGCGGSLACGESAWTSSAGQTNHG